MRRSSCWIWGVAALEFLDLVLRLWTMSAWSFLGLGHCGLGCSGFWLLQLWATSALGYSGFELSQILTFSA